MAYTKQTWVNNETLVDEDRMNHIENGIYQNAEDISEINQSLTDQNIFGAGTILPSGADLNDYMTNGKYYTNNSSLTASLVNCPARGGAISLYVLGLGTGSAQHTQIVFINNSSRMFVRYCDESVSYYDSWNQVTTTTV